jgi:hypothetical protein
VGRSTNQEFVHHMFYLKIERFVGSQDGGWRSKAERGREGRMGNSKARQGLRLGNLLPSGHADGLALACACALAQCLQP